jgi:ribosomal protein L7Ae-like RNA K-turn-binding protein
VKGQASPGNHSSFIVDEELQLLEECDRKYFHSTTAKLLYLAKHARPDILTLVIFLCTRVQYASVQDKEKLERVLGYLKWTEEQVLVLKPCVTGEVVAYVDAANAIHNDSKSHTRVVIYVGDTLVYVSSKKQKCMSKSPTETELIGLTDNLGLIELFHEFVEFVTMKRVNSPTIYQDCNAVVSLVTKGGGQTRINT